MRPATRHKPQQNPFQNRFHEPVTWRLDEMQAHSNVVWPQQRTYNTDRVSNGSTDTQGSFAGAFAFLVVLLACAVVLFRAV